MSNDVDDYLNAKIGEEYKKKLKEIAEFYNRNLTNQIRAWIDSEYKEIDK